MAEQVFLAVDLGASNGRLVLGRFDGAALRLEEAHRFENGPVRVGRGMFWDVLRHWHEILIGLSRARQQAGVPLESIGVDTWGVDYALLAGDDLLLANPRHYRDPRTDGMFEAAFAIVDRETIFAHTGLQFLPFNTLYQLLAEQRSPARLLDVAEQMLLMPDLFHAWLSGARSNEETNASTTQLFNPREGAWDYELIDRFGFPQQLFGDIVPPGTPLGPLRDEVRRATGLEATEVVVPATHDTASAVLAVPARAQPSERPDWCYISSGTWSLMGVELPGPRITDECLRFNFTNEGGVEGTTRLLKNIAGLWLVQQCRQAWNARGATWDWQRLNDAAQAAPPLVSLVDPDAPEFLAPADMPQAIADRCRHTGEPVPEDPGAIIRCALDSLALKYRHVLGQLERLVESRIETIHIVGGGTQNRLLCQATADACGRPVLAGPVEATAMGNLLMQAIARGHVASVAEAREIVRRSFPCQSYQPHDTARWDEAYTRFEKLLVPGP